MVDLHAHTTYSDGTLNPSELVHLAKRKGLYAIGITDHDTVAGLAQAQVEAENQGIDLLCGVELSVEYEMHTGTHILGYFLHHDSQGIADYLEWIVQQRVKRNVLLVENLKAHGYNVSYDELIQKANNKIPGRPHLGALLIEKNYAKNMDDAFERILTKEGIHVQRKKVLPKDAIRAIKEQNGIAVLAHPIYLEKEHLLKKALDEFTGYGLDGIEVYHSDQKQKDTLRYMEMAKEYNLLITGGSDFHGGMKPDIQLGMPKVPKECYEDVIRKLKKQL